MEVANPLRILIVGPPDSNIPRFVKDFTGKALSIVDDTTSIAGASHEVEILNKYYKARIPVWIDEIQDVDEWKNAFSGPEAVEVWEAIGAVVFVFKKPLSLEQFAKLKSTLRAIQDCVELAGGLNLGGWDGVSLAVAMPQSTTPAYDVDAMEWEAVCSELGFEYIDITFKGDKRAREPSGLERIKEAIEAHDWAQPQSGLDSSDEGGDDEDGGFRLEAMELANDLQVLREAAENELPPWEQGRSAKEAATGEADSVEEMESMMQKLLAARELGEGMPVTERKKHAKRAVDDIMGSV
ncbi:MAG: hypothetical protein M1814_003078 [Vezdaea aestivalis]|nr:MAG: hypothetical protein M1814_003078 [Vezdaea aestivalis]